MATFVYNAANLDRKLPPAEIESRHMTLAAGTRLGPYEILGSIGAGGMGEVFRARDTRLEREVALKVLPTSVSGDADRLLRFEQEARATAALNHPNILVVYDIGADAGVSMSSRAARRPDAAARCWRAGRCRRAKRPNTLMQIANGLAAAHERVASSTET